MRHPIRIIAAVASLALLAGCGAEVVHTTGPDGGPTNGSGPILTSTAPVPSPPAGLNRRACGLVNPTPDTSRLVSSGDVFSDDTTGGTQDSEITFVPGLCIPSGLGPNCDMAFPWYSPETIGGTLASEGMTDMKQVTIFSMNSPGTVTETRLEFNPNESDLYIDDAKNCGAKATVVGDQTLLTRTVAPEVFEYLDVSLQVAVGVVFDHMALTAGQQQAIFDVAVRRGQG